VKRADRVFIILLAVVLIYWMLLITNPVSAGLLASLFDWIADAAIVLGYPGAFFACLLGSASVIVEVPFVGVPFVLGGLRDGVSGPFIFDPSIVGLLCGIGATIGDMVSYALGYAGRRLVDEESTSGFSELIQKHPRATPVAVFVLAATPLPLDPAVVALGVARYTWWKLFVPCMIGQIVFFTVVSWSGRFSLDWILGLLGVGGPVTAISATIDVLGILLLIVTVFLVVRLDWTAIVASRKKKGTTDSD
jgi:membrane protein YqaA with SNARE-associated domain